jgi:indole-3-glycerol phosphate synthase
MEIIAEVKTHSPFGWESDRSWEELFEVAASIGDMLSIHTDDRWGGSFQNIARARQLTGLPILAKGIHASDDDVRRALDLGADAVLVEGRLPAEDLLEHCLLEPRTLMELAGLPADARAVWNSRDLQTGGFKAETYERARLLFPGWLCQASNITTWADVHSDADAILIGTNLVEFANQPRP